MIVFTVKDVERLVRTLRTDAETIVRKIVAGVEEGMWVFGGDFVREQISFPRGPARAFGLRVQTGTLRRSFYVRSRVNGNVTRVVYATDVRYAAVHQFGYRAIPKRIALLEKFDKEGAGYLESAVTKRLGRLRK